MGIQSALSSSTSIDVTSPISLRTPLLLPIPQISQADAQVMMERVGNANGKTEAEQSLRQSEHVEIAVADEQQA